MPEIGLHISLYSRPITGTVPADPILWSGASDFLVFDGASDYIIWQ